MFNWFKNIIKDIFFPVRCVSCNKLGEFLCEKCLNGVHLVLTQVCPECNAISKNGYYCPRCRSGKYTSGSLVSASFHEEPVRDLVYALKYDGIIDVSVFLAEIMSKTILKSDYKVDYIAFVPQSRKRTAWRGFNQSEEIARNLSRILGVPVFSGLRKNKNTKPQVGLSKEKRSKNLEGAFEIFKAHKIQGKYVLVVDDVVTTGATLNEVARCLREGGARRVLGVVFAKE